MFSIEFPPWAWTSAYCRQTPRGPWRRAASPPRPKCFLASAPRIPGTGSSPAVSNQMIHIVFCKNFCSNTYFQNIWPEYSSVRGGEDFEVQVTWSNTPLLRLFLPDRLHVQVVQDLPEYLLRPRGPALGVRHDPDVVRSQAEFRYLYGSGIPYMLSTVGSGNLDNLGARRKILTRL